MSELIEVTTTCDCQDAARTLAKKLLEARLVACVQISGPIESHYFWQGQIECQSEWVCRGKSLTGLSNRLFEFISKHHSYQVPEILIQPIFQASSAYEQWLRTELNSSLSSIG